MANQSEQLDFALFERIADGDRFRLIVSIGGTGETISSDLSPAFLDHLYSGLRTSSPLVKLQVDDDDTTNNSPWFTKPTLESFILFAEDPQLLEHPATLAAKTSADKDELRIACERAISAGFSADMLTNLTTFAYRFDDSRLLNAITGVQLAYSRIMGTSQAAAPMIGKFLDSGEDTSSTDPLPDLKVGLKFKVTTDARIEGITISSWTIRKNLGEGGFGKVFEIETLEGVNLAVKIVDATEMNPAKKALKPQSFSTKEKMCLHEVEIMRRLSHPNIIKCYGFDKSYPKVHIFLELMEKGSLRHVYKQGSLTMIEVQKYSRSVLYGLVYLHKNGILHRDIKCANVLVSSSGHVKISDFGLSRELHPGITKPRGTSHWMAPEVLRSSITRECYGLKSDIWSFGCLIVELITGLPPFPNIDKTPLIESFVENKMPTLTCSGPKSLQDLLGRCLNMDPEMRPTAEQLLEHKFFSLNAGLEEEAVFHLGSSGGDCTTQPQKECRPVIMISTSPSNLDLFEPKGLK